MQMSEGVLRKTYGGTNFSVMCDLCKPAEHGWTTIGKARLTLFIPDKKCIEEMNKQDPCRYTGDTFKTLVMDILLNKSIERGWIDYFINSDDISEKRLENVGNDVDQVKRAMNIYLSDNNFNWRVG